MQPRPVPDVDAHLSSKIIDYVQKNYTHTLTLEQDVYKRQGLVRSKDAEVFSISIQLEHVADVTAQLDHILLLDRAGERLSLIHI